MPTIVDFGELGEIEFDDSHSEEQVKELVRQNRDKYKAALHAERSAQFEAETAQSERNAFELGDMPVLEQIGSGVGSFVQGATSVIGGAVKHGGRILDKLAPYASSTDNGETSQRAQAQMDLIEERQKEPASVTLARQEQDPIVQFGQSIRDVPSEAVPTLPGPAESFLLGDVPSGLGSTLGLMAVGAPLAPLGGPALAGAGVALAGGLGEADDAFESEIARQRRVGEKLDVDKALAKSYTYGAISGALETGLGAGRLLRRFQKVFGGTADEALEEAQKHGLKGIIAERLKDAAAEGFTETSQSVAQQLIVEGEVDVKQAAREGAAGLVSALILGIPTGAAEISRLRKARTSQVVAAGVDAGMTGTAVTVDLMGGASESADPTEGSSLPPFSIDDAEKARAQLDEDLKRNPLPPTDSGVPPAPPSPPAPPTETPPVDPAPVPPPVEDAPQPAPEPAPAPNEEPAPVPPPAEEPIDVPAPPQEEPAPEPAPPPVPPPAPQDAPEVRRARARREVFVALDLADGLPLRKKLREIGELHGFDKKQIEEIAESALVERNRNVVRGKDQKTPEGRKATFDELVAAYKRQPKLDSRTPDSKGRQAYSTPAPLAYILGLLAKLRTGKKAVEPTAGNGMLTIGLPDGVEVDTNEIDPGRREGLRENGFAATSVDATATDIFSEHDRFVANPPFGNKPDKNGAPTLFPVPDAVSPVLKQRGTPMIDMAIILNGMKNLKPGGRAAFIIGAKTGSPGAIMGSDQHRRAAYERVEFFELFAKYNVLDWFTVDGSLYERQGAGWPVDIITLENKGPTPLVADGGLSRPWMTPPRVVKSWAELSQIAKDDGNIAPPKRDPAPPPKPEPPPPKPEPPPAPPKRDPAPPPPKLEPPPAPKPDPTKNLSEKDAARLKELQKKLRGKLGGVGSLPFLDPELLALAVEMAILYTKAGIKIFREFAAQIRRDLPELWEQIKGTLRSVWIGAQESVEGLDDPSRSEALATIAEVEKEVAEEQQEKKEEPDKPKAPKGTLQVPYTGKSTREGAGLVTPSNMASPQQHALEALEKEVGPIDDFVSTELQMSKTDMFKALSGAQIDAIGLAIRNIRRGTALINSDQTGVGKGRTVAALIRWATLNGMTPIFVTAKPSLYSDMAHRDLVALGTKVDYIASDKTFVEIIKDIPRRINQKSIEDTMLGIAASGQLPKGKQALFTTYSQLASQWAKGKETPQAKATRKRKGTPRSFGPLWKAIERLNPNALIILDEAHKAAGPESDVGQALQSVLKSSKGVYYLSATFAKRADNLPVFASASILRRAGLTQGFIAEVFGRGGVPMQQAVTEGLTEEGELVRREQPWNGIEVNFVKAVKNEEKERELADTYTDVVSGLFQFSRAIKRYLESLAATENIGRPRSERVSLDAMNFAARLFNLSQQYLLALRARGTVEEAIKEFKAGRKPFIALHNTMEGPLEDLRQRNLPLSFNGILHAQLQKTLGYKHKDRSTGVTTEGELAVDQLPARLQKMHEDLVEAIDAADLGDMPISPIDYILKGIREAGITIDEITARGTAIENDEETGEAKSKSRPSRPVPVVVSEYNNGQLDAILVNGSGAVGLSYHSDPDYKDKRGRSMIVAQAAPDVNDFMQMLGRINRFGQLVLPKYTILRSSLEAEKRFFIMLRAKLSSLNANTSADDQSEMTDQEGFEQDMFNQVGDELAMNTLLSDVDLQDTLDIRVSDDTEVDGMMSRLTGRLLLLSSGDQKKMWAQLESRYREAIERLDEAGENPLKVTAEEWDAEVLSEEKFTDGTGTSMFDGPSTLKKLKIAPQKEVIDHSAAMTLAHDGREKAKVRFREWLAEHGTAQAARIVTMREKDMPDEQVQKTIDRFQLTRSLVSESMRFIGRTFNFDPLGGGKPTMQAVAVRVIMRGKITADFTSPSSQEVVFRTNTSKTITVPMSKLDELWRGGTMVSEIPPNEAKEQFDSSAQSSSERWVVTGNLMRAFVQGVKVGEHPRVVRFTMKDGSAKTGIVLSQTFDPRAGDAKKTDTVRDAVQFENNVETGIRMEGPGIAITGRVVYVRSANQFKYLWDSEEFKDIFDGQQPIEKDGQFRFNLPPTLEAYLFQRLSLKGVVLEEKLFSGQNSAIPSIGWAANKGDLSGHQLEVYHAVQSGDAREALRLVSTGTSNPVMRSIAARMLESAQMPDTATYASAAGANRAESISLPPNASGGFVSSGTSAGKVMVFDTASSPDAVFLHEMVHAFTVGLLESDPAFRRQVEELMATVRRAGYSQEYGMTSPAEFLSEAFSNESFQNVLRAIKVQDTRTLWRRFVDLVRRILGLHKSTLESVLDAVIRITPISGENLGRGKGVYASMGMGPGRRASQAQAWLTTPATQPVNAKEAALKARLVMNSPSTYQPFTEEEIVQTARAYVASFPTLTEAFRAVRSDEAIGELDPLGAMIRYTVIANDAGLAARDTRDPVHASEMIDLSVQAVAAVRAENSFAGQQLRAAQTAQRVMGAGFFAAQYTQMLANRMADRMAGLFPAVIGTQIREWLFESRRIAIEAAVRRLSRVDELIRRALGAQVRIMGTTWTEIFESSLRNQGDVRTNIFRAIAAHPLLQGLSLQDQAELTNILAQGLAREHERVFRAEFRKHVPLPNVGAGNHARLVAATPDLIRWANLGMLSNTAFLAAIATRFGATAINPVHVAEIVDAAQAAQEMPVGFARQTGFRRVYDLMALRSRIHTREIVKSYWYASVMSGLGTQARNFAGSAFQLVDNLAAFSLRELAHGRISSVPRFAMSAIRGLALSATSDFVGAALEGQVSASMVSQDVYESSSALEAATNDERTWMRLLSNFKYVGRFMGAVDSLFYAANAEVQAMQQAIVQGVESGLTAAQLDAHIESTLLIDQGSPAWVAAGNTAAQEAADGLLPDARPSTIRRRTIEIVNQLRPADILREMHRLGLEGTLNNQPTGLIGLIYRFAVTARAQFPILTPLMPFIRISANITNMFLDHSPAGVIRLIAARPDITQGHDAMLNAMNAMGGHRFRLGEPLSMEAWQQLRAKIFISHVVATAAMLIAGSFIDDDEPLFQLTGSFDNLHISIKTQLAAQGIKPYQVRIGGVSIGYLQTPVALMFAIIGGVLDAQRYNKADTKDDSSLKKFAGSMGGAGAVIIDQQFLSSIASLLGRGSYGTSDATAWKKIMRFAGRSVGGFVPNITKEVESWLPVADARKADTFIESVQREIPVLRWGLEPYLNALGDEIDLPKTPWGWLIHTDEDDPVWVALKRLAQKGVFVPQPSASVTVSEDGVRGEMTADEFARYAKRCGQLYRAKFTEDINLIRGMTPDEAVIYFERALPPLRARARGEAFVR